MGGNSSKISASCFGARKRLECKYDNPERQDPEEGRFWLEANKDKYFTSSDLEDIAKKYPEHEGWMEQSMKKSVNLKQKQKKIAWKEGEVIGKGSFGNVKFGLNVKTGCIMAIKQVDFSDKKSRIQQDRIDALEVEIELLKKLSHRNIVKYYGSVRTEDTLNIFLEYVSGGSIASLIQKFGALPESVIQVYTRQILEGLEYLHIRNTIHRDIKGANILVDNNGTCKLTDFGTATRISSIMEKKPEEPLALKGTLNWMAPEVIKQTMLGRQSDIWSVGCTVLEMATGQPPWFSLAKPNCTSMSLLYQIAKAKSHPPIPKDICPEMLHFLHQCFKINPYDRPSVTQLLKHPFVNKTEKIPRSMSGSGEEKLVKDNSVYLQQLSSKSSKDKDGRQSQYPFNLDECGNESSIKDHLVKGENNQTYSYYKSPESKPYRRSLNTNSSGGKFRIKEKSQQIVDSVSENSDDSVTPQNKGNLQNTYTFGNSQENGVENDLDYFQTKQDLLEGVAHKCGRVDGEQEHFEGLEVVERVLMSYKYRINKKDSDTRSRDSDCDISINHGFSKKNYISRQNTAAVSERGLNPKLSSEEAILPSKGIFGLMFLQKRETNAKTKQIEIANEVQEGSPEILFLQKSEADNKLSNMRGPLLRLKTANHIPLERIEESQGENPLVCRKDLRSEMLVPKKNATEGNDLSYISDENEKSHLSCLSARCEFQKSLENFNLNEEMQRLYKHIDETDIPLKV